MLVVPPLHGPLWPLAAAPPWPPLSVADSTTQWLPLLKQSCFLPLASAHIRFFHVLSLRAHFPPHTDKQHFNCSPGCSNRFLPRGSRRREAAGSLTEVPALFPPVGQRPQCLRTELLQSGLVCPSTLPQLMSSWQNVGLSN